MDWNADHAGFVIAAYALSLVFIACLIIYIFSRDARARRLLMQFHAKQIKQILESKK
jgi:heme exporter protein CcmD